jgi:hypothetical protein
VNGDTFFTDLPWWMRRYWLYLSSVEVSTERIVLRRLFRRKLVMTKDRPPGFEAGRVLMHIYPRIGLDPEVLFIACRCKRLTAALQEAGWSVAGIV